MTISGIAARPEREMLILVQPRVEFARVPELAHSGRLHYVMGKSK